MAVPISEDQDALVDPAPDAFTEVSSAPAKNRRPGLPTRFLHKAVPVGAAVFLLLLVLACVLAPLLAPYGPAETDFANASVGPSGAHWLGTDKLGYDVLSRVLYGGRETLPPVVVTVAVAAVAGIPLGMISGFKGGLLDRATGWVLDGVMAIPALIFLLAVLAVIPHNMTVAMAVFGLLVTPQVAKVVRAVVLGVRGEQYIDLARISGIGDLAIMRRHIASKIAGAVVVQLTSVAGIALIAQSGLEFLGLGPQPPTPTWGNLISTAAESIHQQPWLLVPSGALLALTVLSLWFVGDGLRDALAERWQQPAAAFPRRRVQTPRTAPAPDHDEDAAAVVELHDLSVSFGTGENRLPVLESVGVSVRPGQTVALLGESGCGKSVTALALSGLLPGTAHVDTGTVRIDQSRYDLHADVDLPRGNGISVIFQEPLAALDPTLTVSSILTGSVRRHTGAGRRTARNRATELLDDVGIRDPEAVMDRYPHELSGGMAQRVCIARALTGNPTLLIADEPTTALDVTVQAGVLNLLRERQAETGLAILFVTHDWGVVADIAHRCVVMYAGQVVEAADVDELFSTARHPYTRGLLKANPSQGTRGERLAALPGRVPTPAEWPAGCRFQDRCAFATEACTTAPIPLTTTDDGRQVRCVHWKEINDAG